jgi:thiamine biosynthesis lipoprotein
MQTVTLAHNAMATRFEVVVHGNNRSQLRAAGEEALDEIDRIENQLSLYRPSSEIAQLNARAAREAVLVSPEVFALLQHAQRLSAETQDAFDITIGPLVRCWGFMGGTGRKPAAAEVAAAHEKVGMQNLVLDPADRTVRYSRDGVMLDLGAIGKGYAVDRAAQILREAGVASALIHGGTSTTCAIGRPPEAESWKIAIDVTGELERHKSAQHKSPEPKNAKTVGGTPSAFAIPLCDESLSISAASGRQFESDGEVFGHVIDPRTGRPVQGAILSLVALPSATETDALSTALLTLGARGLEDLSSLRAKMRSLVVIRSDLAVQVDSRGFSREAVAQIVICSGNKNPVEK